MTNLEISCITEDLLEILPLTPPRNCNEASAIANNTDCKGCVQLFEFEETDTEYGPIYHNVWILHPTTTGYVVVNLTSQNPLAIDWTEKDTLAAVAAVFPAQAQATGLEPEITAYREGSSTRVIEVYPAWITCPQKHLSAVKDYLIKAGHST